MTTVDVSSAIDCVGRVTSPSPDGHRRGDLWRRHKCQKELVKANEEMGKAAAELPGNPDKAIDHYKKAWEHAMKAMDKAIE